MDKEQCIAMLKAKKHKLTPQQYLTIRGQILAGDIEGAKKGLARLERRSIKA